MYKVYKIPTEMTGYFTLVWLNTIHSIILSHLLIFYELWMSYESIRIRFYNLNTDGVEFIDVNLSRERGLF